VRGDGFLGGPLRPRPSAGPQVKGRFPVADFVKANDQELRAQLALFNTVVGAGPVPYGLTPAIMLIMDNLAGVFSGALDDHVAAQELAKSRTESKQLAREAAVAEFRTLVAQIQANPNVTDAQRSAAGIPIRDDSRTPAGIPDSRPVIDVAEVEGGRHVLRMTDSATNKRTRPTGAAKLVLYRKVVATGTPAPADLAEMEQVNAYTTSKVILNYDGSENGKTVYYGACYANVKNESGPVSTIVAATIAA
jgi:hypothetical protein